jgi:hypothetical protein
VTLVFTDRFADDTERRRAHARGTRPGRRSGTELDLDLLDEAGVSGGRSPQSKCGGIVAYGEGILDAVPILPISAWARPRMHAADGLIRNVFPSPPTSSPRSATRMRATSSGATPGARPAWPTARKWPAPLTWSG